MMCVPHIRHLNDHRVYRDSVEDGVVYVDATRPVPERPPHAWWTKSRKEAHLSAEVRFGPVATILARVRELYPKRRVLPVDYGVQPVFAWTKGSDSIHRLPEGYSSGYGSHHAVLNGSAPQPDDMAVAAEFSADAVVDGARVRARGDGAIILQALDERLRVEAIDWNLTIGDVMAAILSDAVDRRAAEVKVNLSNRPMDALEEIRRLVFLTWARRMAGVLGLSTSLAEPAVRVAWSIREKLRARGIDACANDLDLTLCWTSGDRVRTRLVKTLLMR